MRHFLTKYPNYATKMAERLVNKEFDGIMTLEMGVNSDLAPSLINPTNCHWAENCTFREGYATQRPAWVRKTTLTGSGGVGLGFFQGAYYYRARNGVNQLVVSIGGHLYSITPDLNFQIQEITVSNDPNPSNLRFAYFVQAEEWLIINDGLSKPIFYNGASSRRAQNGELTTGTVAAYSKGRVWYANAQGTSFRAGDLVGSSSGTATYQYRDAVLKLTENSFLNGGGSFSVPDSSGTITAMAVPASLDTSLGQGPLQVFTQTACFSVNAPVDRTEWQNTTYPVQTVSQIVGGAVSHRSATLVNGDVFYRSLDGIRTFIMARRYFDGAWGNAPISREVSRAIDYDNIYNLDSESSTLWDNRLLHLCWGRTSQYGIYHTGILPIDFDPVSVLHDKRDPRWEGLWTGLKIFQIISGNFGGVDRCFAFVLDDSYQTSIEIWELRNDQVLDNQVTRIPCAIESAGLFRDSKFNKKELQSARLFYSDLLPGITVNWDVKYRPDNYPCFIGWRSWSECANGQTCEEECLAEVAPQPQYRTRVGLTSPSDTCNPVDNSYLRRFYQMQLRVAWEGPATLNQVRADATQIDDKPFGDCQTVGECKTVECCVPDPTTYSIN